jgi:hypothetical protein
MFNDLLLRNAAVDVCGDEEETRYCEAIYWGRPCGMQGAEWSIYEGRYLCRECASVWNEMEEPNE